MDEIAKYNRERWNDLVRAGVEFARPWLNLTPQQARQKVDPHNFIGDVTGKEVLCLAGAGGQQSLAFSVLGANVTVLDLSDEMLAQDRKAAAQAGLTIRHEQGDMRDLSRFSNGSFDVVYHAHSINFIPEVKSVFDEVNRVLKPGGIYQLHFYNPYAAGIDERSWDGQGYRVGLLYIQGQPMPDLPWDFEDEQGNYQVVAGPHEFRHTMSGLLNGLLERGFMLLRYDELTEVKADAEPGSWDHYLSVFVPDIGSWWKKSQAG